MAFPEDLQTASYRGVEWFVSSTTTAGGRKVSRKQFVSSDLELIEDLGKKQREFTITGVIAARRNNEGKEILSYKEARSTLLEALEKGGTGVLVHPFFGRLNNIAVITFSLNEKMDSLGESSINITFGISNSDGQPQTSRPILGGISNKNDEVTEKATGVIAAIFKVTSTFTGNFQDGIDKLNEFIDTVRTATDPIALVADKVDAFNKEVSDFTTNISSLVNNPTDLSESIGNILSTMGALYATPEATLDAFKGLFDYGDGDTVINQTTSSLIERELNRDTLNSTVQAQALGFAYLNAAERVYTSVEEVNQISQDLETQYQKILVSGVLDSDVVEALTEMRISVSEFFDDQRISAPQVFTVNTPLTSARLLAYQYYGVSTLGDTIALLNNADDPTCLEGDVKILTA